MNLPNLVTLLRLFAIPFIVILLFNNVISPYWAMGLFLLVAVSDALDGWLARKLNQVTDLGKFLDPIVDKALIITVLLILALQNNVLLAPAAILIGREIIVSVWRAFLAKKRIIVPAGKLGKLKMILEVIAVSMLIINLAGGLLVLWIAVVLSLLSAVEYLLNGLK
ncbi:MAG: CDP-diacylglycerol--glycerol-3-phosphate 3-phosphatidyltransferase [bacterium]